MFRLLPKNINLSKTNKNLAFCPLFTRFIDRNAAKVWFVRDIVAYYSDYINPRRRDENPFQRTVRILKQDFKRVKNRMNDINDEYQEGTIFPDYCDIVIIGGGIMGSSIAYWLQQRALDGLRVVVIEKDSSYKEASTVLSVGGLRQQFSLAENIEMSLFGAEFLRHIKEHLSVKAEEPPEIHFNHCGYLFLASEKGVDTLKENHKLQTSLGAKSELLTAKRLKKKFPWINTDGVELGCHGLENEGWFDPWSLLHAFRLKAGSLGTQFINGEVVGFGFSKMTDVQVEGHESGQFEGLEEVNVKLDNGEIRPIKFSLCVVAAGAQSGEIARMARIGSGPGSLMVPLPVEPRKRYVYNLHCADGPGLHTPLTVDPTGTYFRREGLGGNYICGLCPDPEDEPATNNLDVDHTFFDNHIWPVIAHRVPAFEAIKVKSAWAGYYDYNFFDRNGIIGPHPGYLNLYFATGFSGHGLQQAPAVGRAIMELIVDGRFTTIDLKRMCFERILNNEPVLETNIV